MIWMGPDLLPPFILDHYEVHEWKHACAVLHADFPDEWADIIAVLTDFRLPKSHVLAPGGGLSLISQWFNQAFFSREWVKKAFDTKITVDQNEALSPTHEVDCFKNRVALEIEWSNKDPFYDRDLNNFRLLFDLRAISVGIIITKADELSEIFKELGKKTWEKYGWSSTWMRKLLPRIEGGGGGGCPILVFGISKRLYIEDE